MVTYVREQAECCHLCDTIERLRGDTEGFSVWGHMGFMFMVGVYARLSEKEADALGDVLHSIVQFCLRARDPNYAKPRVPCDGTTVPVTTEQVRDPASPLYRRH